jgi:hypothetical protein
VFDALPDIPRLFTGLAEWSACLVYIMLMRRRLAPLALATTLAGGLALLIGVQLLAAELPIALWTLGMLLAVASMYGLILLCTNSSPRQAGFLVARAFVLAELVASLEWQLHTYFLDDSTPSWVGYALVGSLYAAAFSFVYIIERRHFPENQVLTVDNRMLVTSAGIAIVTFLMSNLSFVTSNSPFTGRGASEVFYIRTLVDLAGFVVLYALRGQQLAVQRSIEVDVMNVIVRNQRDQYLQSKHDIDQVNRKYHDLKHYIHAIRAESNPQLRATYVDRLEDSIRGYEQTALNTDNVVLDTILTAKRAQCEREGINLTIVADGSAVDFIDAMDLVTIVGNSLDNAIEASSRLIDPEHRLIRVAIYRQGRFAMIKVENYFEGDLDIIDGLPRTTKAHSTHHGYGLKNMTSAAQHYGGTLTARVEHDWFVVRTLVPIADAAKRINATRV